MIIKRLVLISMVFVVSALIYILCWYIDYNRNLTPKLMQAVDVEIARQICPELGPWENNSNPWEFLPRDLTRKICISLKIPCDNVVATYKKKIVSFLPYCFNAVKGEIKIEPCNDDVIFIYSYAPRYAPTFEGP